MESKFIIQDWAGNEIGLKNSNGITVFEEFETFEDAWNYILGELTDRLGLTEEDYQEYYVVPKVDKQYRFLDPNDIRNRG